MNAIFQLGGVVEELFEARLAKDKIRYNAALEKIPIEYHDKYHCLLSLLVQFIITYFDGRRGIEGIAFLLKTHWAVSDENGKKYLKKVNISG